MKRLAILLLALPMAANATPIVGEYSGTWDQIPSFVGVVDMSITSQVSTGSDSSDIFGFFDWTCTGGPFPCSGREFFRGTLIGDLLDVTGYALIDPINLVLGTYTATVAPDGRSITGTFPDGTWEVTRVSEPTTLALLSLGLAGLGFARRRKQARISH